MRFLGTFPWLAMAIALVFAQPACKKDAAEKPAAGQDEPAVEAGKGSSEEGKPAAAAPTTAAEPAAQEEEVRVEVLGMKALPQPELRARANRFAPVEISYDDSGLDDDQKKIVQLLVGAATVMDQLFWEQASVDGLEIFEALREMDSKEAATLRRYVRINYSRFDRLDGFEPFLGDTPSPLGATFYPPDMTAKEFGDWVAAHPEQKDALRSEFTVIRRVEGGLAAVPYSKHYADKLAIAAQKLREAAGLAKNASLKKYLETRAKAFESNDYFESDMAWMDIVDSPIEVTIGPYEVYEDRLFNQKAAFEAFVTLTDPAAAAELHTVAGYLPKMERHLPIPDEHKNFDRGSESPIRVVDVVFTAGDSRAGVQTLAFNLPNDERVREAKGSKKVLLRNISNAKFSKILMPIAKRVMAEDQLPFVAEDAYFKHTLMHEMSHGIGPGNITLADGTKTNVQRSLKETYSSIEEAKADILGIYNAFYLIDEGVFPKEMEKQTAITALAGTFRSVRFGIEEAHGRANMVLFNYLTNEGAYVYDAETGRFSCDLEKIRPATRKLAAEILMIEARGDYEAAKKMLETWGGMPDSMKKALAGLEGIPVDIEPIYAIEQQPKP